MMIFGITYLNLIIRITGILGVACSVTAFQCKKHYGVMAFRTAQELLFAFQYFLLGGFTGALLNVISAGRNLLFAEYVKKHKSTNIWRIVFSAFFIIFPALTWAGFETFIFCAGKLITTYVFGSKNMTFLRIMTVITSIMWIIYNVCLGSFEGIISDSLTIVSTFIAIIRYDITKRGKAA